MNVCQVLSSQGSDRATAYNMSSKIIRREGALFVGWLDAPVVAGGAARVQLGVCQAGSGRLQQTILLGEGSDNHCGPALALDKDGRLHALCGAHHGSFSYRWSDRPADPASWSNPEMLGPFDTYPSLAVDASGVLHLAHREKADRWQLWYRRKKPGRPWEAPQALAISPTPGYNHFMQSLTIGPGGSIHLIFQYHYAESGRAIDCVGRAAIHLQSDDGGETWFNEGARCDDLPLTIDTMRPICHYPDGGVRVANHVVDADNNPWFFASIPGMKGGALFHRTGADWDAIDMTEALGNLNMAGGRSVSISRDAAGQIHLGLATHPDGLETPWFHAGHELFYLRVDAAGNVQPVSQVTHTDPNVAGWLPALEQWDWTRPQAACANGPWFMYTCGLNQGGIGGNNANTLATEVFLGKLD